MLGQVGPVIEFLVQVDQDDLIERQPRPVGDPLELVGHQWTFGAHDLAAGRGVLEQLPFGGRFADERRVDSFVRKSRIASRNRVPYARPRSWGFPSITVAGANARTA